MVPVVAGSIPVVRPTPDIFGLVLAGGRARRLGGADKPLFPFGPHTLMDEIIARLAPQVAALAISANTDAYAARGLPVLPDGQPAGPLAGVLAGLEWAETAGAKAVLTVPGDTPFIPRDLVSRLVPAPACAASFGRVHHLVALWPVQARLALATHLARGSFRVSDFGRSIGMRQVRFEATPDPFFNVNTPDDLARLREV